MSDEQHGDPAGQLQGAEQGEDAGLDRHVERGGRLVGDQDLRIAGEGPGDGDPLRHAAGDLVRVEPRDPFRFVQLDPAQQGEHPLPCLPRPQPE